MEYKPSLIRPSQFEVQVSPQGREVLGGTGGCRCVQVSVAPSLPFPPARSR